MLLRLFAFSPFALSPFFLHKPSAIPNAMLFCVNTRRKNHFFLLEEVHANLITKSQTDIQSRNAAKCTNP
jgi:hypothetical protein